jgi:hypothetical protein
MKVIFENQRFRSVLTILSPPAKDRYATTHLLAEDGCCAFSDESGKSKNFDYVQLPEMWYWLTDWKVDLKWPNTDLDGWSYAPSFSSSVWRSDPSEADVVRRRRWIRVRKYKFQPNEIASSEQKVICPSYLERAKMKLGPSFFSLEPVQQLAQYEQAISIALSGMRSDNDADRKSNACELVDQWIKSAMIIKEAVKKSGSQNQTSFHHGSSSSSIPHPPETDDSQEQAKETRILPEVTARWQSDEEASNCNSCYRTFSFFLRRHHCRWCGRVFCDRCSGNRQEVVPGMILGPGNIADQRFLSTSPMRMRVCNSCYGRQHAADHFRSRAQTMPPMTSNPSTQQRQHSQTTSNQSIASTQPDVIFECPICRIRFDSSETPMTQADIEGHLNNCLTKGAGKEIAGDRYIGMFVLLVGILLHIYYS